MFKELFTGLNESYKGKLKLKSDNTFLTYPKDMVLDINDAFGDVVDDYDINGNNVVITYKDGTDVKTMKMVNNHIRKLQESKIIKKGDEFYHKRSDKAVIFQELVKSPDGSAKVELTDSRSKKKISISDKVFKSSYDLSGRVLG